MRPFIHSSPVWSTNCGVEFLAMWALVLFVNGISIKILWFVIVAVGQWTLIHSCCWCTAGIEGGFDVGEKKYDIEELSSVLVMPGWHEFPLSLPGLPEKVILYSQIKPDVFLVWIICILCDVWHSVTYCDLTETACFRCCSVQRQFCQPILHQGKPNWRPWRWRGTEKFALFQSIADLFSLISCYSIEFLCISHGICNLICHMFHCSGLIK